MFYFVDLMVLLQFLLDKNPVEHTGPGGKDWPKLVPVMFYLQGSEDEMRQPRPSLMKTSMKVQNHRRCGLDVSWVSTEAPKRSTLCYTKPQQSTLTCSDPAHFRVTCPLQVNDKNIRDHEGPHFLPHSQLPSEPLPPKQHAPEPAGSNRR
ncbi:hypothetical protein ATANTOWER_026269 [Ataeniobius toweri]|uniref:Uncharacterized protein n=1 Tax=Ataeniobius toweri TaxID=208326 RepID=A0ABU7A9M4_9TELE|nr:hypothetical protein [Ataeniobius toweri]